MAILGLMRMTSRFSSHSVWTSFSYFDFFHNYHEKLRSQTQITKSILWKAHKNNLINYIAAELILNSVDSAALSEPQRCLRFVSSTSRADTVVWFQKTAHIVSPQ